MLDKKVLNCPLREDGLLIVDYKNIKSLSRVIAAFLARVSPRKLAAYPLVQRNFINMTYGMSRRHMDHFLIEAGFKKLIDYSKPPRLLEFGNASDYQAGIRGAAWRSMNTTDGWTDNRAWIQVVARKPRS